LACSSMNIKNVSVGTILFREIIKNNFVVNVIGGKRYAVVTHKKSVYVVAEQKQVCNGSV